MHNFPVKLELRIDWSELDLFNHVNNVMFMKYVQAARVNYWEQIGLYQYFLETKIGPMLASTKCDFKRPLFYPGKIQIETSCETIGNTSFGFYHRISDEQGNLAAEAHDVMVWFDFNTNEKKPFPGFLKIEIEKLEGRRF